MFFFLMCLFGLKTYPKFIRASIDPGHGFYSLTGYKEEKYMKKISAKIYKQSKHLPLKSFNLK